MGIESLLASLRAAVTPVTHVHASNDAGSGVTAGDLGDVTAVTPPAPVTAVTAGKTADVTREAAPLLGCTAVTAVTAEIIIGEVDTGEPGRETGGNHVSTSPSDGWATDYPLPADDRITCPACDHYTPPGCRACRRGLFSFRSRDHHPDPLCPHRCLLFAPLANDLDQRPGAARWPSLAWQRRAPK